ncbi:MAG: nitroreductase family protein [Bacteroidetes bacterium]|nr:MAG: nitroreductase family protein [Bacteroidota bacterium]
MEKDHPFIPYTKEHYSEEEMTQRAKEFRDWAETRRSVRHFSNKHVPIEVMEELIMTGSSAPSGAHKQPWTFCLISNKELKAKLRELAEEEEYRSYNGRMSEEWIKDLAPLGTDWHKEFIDIAPWIVIIMKRAYEVGDEGKKLNNYYVSESVGLAAGFFLMAVHNAGLVALTHTPSPMNFISKALNRPENERPFLLIPVGYPADNAVVPDLSRKLKDSVIEYYL